MSASVTRRYILLLVLISVAIFRCSSMHTTDESFCHAGNGSKSRPMICVDEKTLTANPGIAHVFDVESDSGHPTNRTVVIHWFTQQSADLHVAFKTEECTEPVVCDGRGHCMARVKRLSGNEHRQCTYGMTIGDNKIDPFADIVVDPCCW
jgi:hypothetical protein